MRCVDIIEKKKRGEELSRDEIAYFVEGYTLGTIPDYQASALAMAIYFNKMTRVETAALTLEMAKAAIFLTFRDSVTNRLTNTPREVSATKQRLLLRRLQRRQDVPSQK